MPVKAFFLALVSLAFVLAWSLYSRRTRPQDQEFRPSGDNTPKASALKTAPNLLNRAGNLVYAAPMRMGITLLLLAAALYIILSKTYDSESKQWAFGVVGIIAGYWLKATPD